MSPSSTFFNLASFGLIEKTAIYNAINKQYQIVFKLGETTTSSAEKIERLRKTFDGLEKFAILNQSR